MLCKRHNSIGSAVINLLKGKLCIQEAAKMLCESDEESFLTAMMIKFYFIIRAVSGAPLSSSGLEETL